ncbi:hypothetical protein [Nocardioides zeicaulis]|uniref:Lipoprotein n=1 Tax=Nocardioides zeicaulis TaxID=1776857 RepID=A0ABV6E0D1_9ACTN
MTRTWRGRTAALAVAATLAVTGCRAGGGTPAPPDAASADGPTAAGAPGPSTDPTPAAPPAGVGIVPALRRWLVLRAGSRLPRPRAGVVVEETRREPVGPTGATESLGLSLRRGDRARWVLAVVDEDGLHVDLEHPRLSAWLTVDPWLADTAGIEEGGPGLVLAEMGPDGSMVALAHGARVLHEAVVPDGALGQLRESVTSTAAVAIVRWRSHRWFVLAERLPSRTRHVTVAASRSGFHAATAAELVTRWERASRAP